MGHPDPKVTVPHEDLQNVLWGPSPQKALSGSIHPGSSTHSPSSLLSELLNLLSKSFRAAFYHITMYAISPLCGV